MNDSEFKGIDFQNAVNEVKEYEKNSKSLKKIEYTQKKIGNGIKLHIRDMNFNQLTTEMEKMEKIIATTGYSKTIEKAETPGINEMMHKIKTEKEKRKQKKEEIKNIPDLSKMDTETQIKRLNEINEMQDYILISYAREYMKEVYDEFNAGEITPEKFRYEIKRKIAINSGISENLINEKIQRELNPFEEMEEQTKRK